MLKFVSSAVFVAILTTVQASASVAYQTVTFENLTPGPLTSYTEDDPALQRRGLH